MGQIANKSTPMYLVENVDAAKALKVNSGTTAPLAYVTQTTLSVDDAAAIVATLKTRYPEIVGPKKDDICYATQNRQDAVRRLAEKCDVILVVGSANSSNSNRLREVAEGRKIPAYLIDNADDINPLWLDGKQCIGVTAGASAPEVLIEEIVQRLKTLGPYSVSDMNAVKESANFPLPIFD